MKIIVSESTDAVFNLSAEKYLLTERPGEDVLFLYINERSVIVGRNQNPESEADIEFCLQNNIPVLKRLSGGGTVYHDTGNINFCFIKDKNDDLVLDTDFLTPIICALDKFGIKAEAGKRKDLWLGSKKISGTASHITRTRHLFHGTILYDADLLMLEKALTGNVSARGKSVASVKSEVTNIKDHISGRNLSTFEFFGELKDRLMEYYLLEEIETIGKENSGK